MRERSDDAEPRPVPRPWLPDPQPADEDPKWERAIEQIMTAAAPELARLTGGPSAVERTWWSRMGLWWRPAAGLAAASAALFLLFGRTRTESQPDSIPLALIAADGDPATLWGALGIEADPVLAMIAIQEQPSPTEPGSPAAVSDGEEDR